MPFLWLDIDDPPGPESRRACVEVNSIALLSNYERTAVHPPSRAWLGLHCPRETVRGSGLWNQRHVELAHDPAFLDILDDLIVRQVGRRNNR